MMRVGSIVAKGCGRVRVPRTTREYCSSSSSSPSLSKMEKAKYGREYMRQTFSRGILAGVCLYGGYQYALYDLTPERTASKIEWMGKNNIFLNEICKDLEEKDERMSRDVLATLSSIGSKRY